MVPRSNSALIPRNYNFFRPSTPNTRLKNGRGFLSNFGVKVIPDQRLSAERSG